VTATDASLLVNNIAVTGSSNTFEDVIPGVTVTAYKKDPAAIVRVDVAADSSALTAKVTDFVSAYNNVVKFMNDQRASAANGDTTSIGREPLLAQLRNSLRTELLGPHGSGALTRLSEAGVEFTRTGTLALNSARFDDAVATDGAGVQALFADTGGAFPAVTALLDAYSKGTGFIPSMKDRLNQQVAAMDSQISAMQDRLALQRQAMQQEFTAADQAMSQLKSQSDSLANLASQLKF
jgi:flagellar hook-associated protein 2